MILLLGEILTYLNHTEIARLKQADKKRYTAVTKEMNHKNYTFLIDIYDEFKEVIEKSVLRNDNKVIDNEPTRLLLLVDVDEPAKKRKKNFKPLTEAACILLFQLLLWDQGEGATKLFSFSKYRIRHWIETYHYALNKKKVIYQIDLI